MASLLLDIDDCEVNNDWFRALRLLKEDTPESLAEYDRMDKNEIYPSKWYDEP